jgi:mannitol-1-phosphate 5-dehydrogenase
MATLIQFGAGNIGRSFVAQLFSAAGYDVIFVDVVDELVTQLNARGQYTVVIQDTRQKEITVERVRAIHGEDVDAVAEALAEADIAATAVGPNALSHLYPSIANGLALRYARHGVRPLDIILAENLRHAAAIVRTGLRRHLPPEFPLERIVGLAETSIGKMVPIMTDAQRAQDPLLVYAEAYNTLIVDAEAFLNPVPAVPGLAPTRNIAAYVERKLFVHNLGHAAAAYLGYLADPYAGYIWQVMEQREIREMAEAAMWESGRALIAAYPEEFTEGNLRAHIDDLLGRFANRALGDTVFRVGRDLLRKLSRDDRVIGAMRFDLAHGVACPATARVAAAAFEFRGTDERHRLYAPDAKFAEAYYPRGLDTILTEVCGLDLHDPEDERVAQAISMAQVALEKVAR